MRPHRTLLLAALVAAFSFPLSVGAQSVAPDAGPVAASIVAASATGVVRITGIAGDLQITGWSRAEVSVSGGSIAPRITSDPDQSLVAIGGRESAAALLIRVPVGSRVEVRNVEGTITVKGVAGALKLTSVNGSIRVEGSPSDVEARTVSGAVDLSIAKSDAHATSVTGDLRVQCAAGRVTTKTVSGKTVVGGGPLEHLQMRTVSGALEFDGKLAKGATSEFRSHSGAIAVTLPKASAGTFELRTRGVIRNRIVGDAGTERDFTRGSGGPSVAVSSFNGDISLGER